MTDYISVAIAFKGALLGNQCGFSACYWPAEGGTGSIFVIVLFGLTLPNQSPNLIVTPERGGLFSDRYPSAFMPSAYTAGVISALPHLSI